MTSQERNLRARRVAAEPGYALQAVRGTSLGRLLYTAARRPFAPVFVDGLAAVERWLVDQKRA